MHVLICNDDGVNAQGIKALARAFRDEGYRVTVSAPDEERSCAGHSFTMKIPLYVSEVKDWLEGVKAYQVSGTPADCCRIALESLIKDKVDLVVSGINRGGNTGSDTLYSGTVAAAMEGAMLGVKALSVSLVHGGNWDYEPAAALALQLAGEILAEKLPPCPVYNLNVPPVPLEEIKGRRIAPLCLRKYDGGYEKRISPLGIEYYWLNSHLNTQAIDPDSDVALVRQGWATLTPLDWRLTHARIFQQLTPST